MDPPPFYTPQDPRFLASLAANFLSDRQPRRLAAGSNDKIPRALVLQK